jgi:hypothetical protein
MAFYDQNGNAQVGYTQGLQPLVSLSAVSATGPGAALDAVTCRGNLVMTVTTSASVTAGSVQMQGSLDNVRRCLHHGREHNNRCCGDEPIHALCPREYCDRDHWRDGDRFGGR